MAPVKSGEKSTRLIPDGKSQVNFNVQASLLDKVKAIARRAESSNSEVFNKALEYYIAEFEKKNGKVRVTTKVLSLDL